MTVRSMLYTTARMIETHHKDAPAGADMVKILASDAADHINLDEPIVRIP